LRVRFDANLSILYGDRPLLDRPAAAAAAGFDAVEMWWPFADLVPAAADVDRLVESFGKAGVALVSMNLASGSVDAGQHGLLALPDERTRFRDHLDAAIAIAGRLGGRVLNALYGNPPEGIARGLLDDTAVENLAIAAQRAVGIGATIVLEALNPVDFPRYGLHRTGESLALADRVRAETGEDVAILFDIYNVQRSEGDLLARIAAHAGRFGHVQIADVPGRLRPGTGEVAFERVLPALEAAGYAGYVGLEYRPSPDPADTFAWLPVERRRSRGTIRRVEREGGWR
jgi:hydroxypyruvate isomerase